MKKVEMLKVENYFEAVLILTLLGFFFLLIKSYVMPILVATAFVFIVYPLFLKLIEALRNRYVAAVYLLFFVLFIILLPTYVIIVSVINETSIIIKTSDDIIQDIDLGFCEYEFCRSIEKNLEVVDNSYEEVIILIGEYLRDSAGVIFDSVSKIVINLFVFILAFFYLLIDGPNFMKYVKRIIPMKNEYKDALFIKFRDVSSAVFLNTILIAIIQGTLVGIGFWIFSISSPLFWGVIASFFSLIPMVGAAIVWVPAVVYLILTETYLQALLLLLYGVVIISFSDNIIRPYLLKRKMKIHPFLILLSILGGIEVFGFMGIFVGPIIISLLISVIQLYRLDFR